VKTLFLTSRLEARRVLTDLNRFVREASKWSIELGRVFQCANWISLISSDSFLSASTIFPAR
jgi:hypothetical protein